jgi:hypothetical protein
MYPPDKNNILRIPRRGVIPSNYSGCVETPKGERIILHNGKPHSLIGPAVIDHIGGVHWIIRGVDCTKLVKDWIQDLGLPAWQDWSKEHLVLFRLTWG